MAHASVPGELLAVPDGMTKISLLHVTEEMLLNLWLIKIGDVFKISTFDLFFRTLAVGSNTASSIYCGFKDLRQLFS